MKVVITSKNPVKINATRHGFETLFPNENFQLDSVEVPSDVSDQPMSEKETLQGAYNRIKHAMKSIPDADYWVGIEGGIALQEKEMETFAWIIIQNNSGQVGKGRTGTFFLPEKIAQLVSSGIELGKADDIVFNQTNSKQNQGSIGILTKNVIDRTEYYKPAVIFALIPFINTDLY